jgi:hypothetical protein
MAATEEQQQENPLLEGLSLRRTPDPCALVIFGASGDLTHKKLMPSLYSLMFRRLLPPRFAIVGVARSEQDDDAFREDMKESVRKHARDEFREDVWNELAQSMHTSSGAKTACSVSRICSSRSTASASSVGTASTTSPCLRRRFRRSSRSSARTARRTGGRA